MLEGAEGCAVSPQEGLQEEIGRGLQALRSHGVQPSCSDPREDDISSVATPWLGHHSPELPQNLWPAAGSWDKDELLQARERHERLLATVGSKPHLLWVPWRASHILEGMNLSLSIEQSSHISTLIYTEVPAFPQTSEKASTMMYVSEYKRTNCFHQAVKHSKIQSSDLQKTALFTSVPETFYIKATTEKRPCTYLREFSKWHVLFGLYIIISIHN